MTTTPTIDLTQQFTAVVEAASAVSSDVADFQASDDAALVSLSRLAARAKQLVDAHLALVAGEIAARSTREMGHSGLAQREGFRTAEELVKATSGASGKDATTAVRVGRLVREAATSGQVDPTSGEVFEAREPWLACVAAAVASGALSVGAADAIRTGLGLPTDNVPAAALADAAGALCALASTLDLDLLRGRAREFRDDLDEAGIADRERERFEKRALRVFSLGNGMGRLVWDLDPESYATVLELNNRATSPKRGVRFVSGENQQIAERILNDPRTIGQLASDTFLGLLQAGAHADSTNLLGTGAASIRVLVTKKTLETAGVSGAGGDWGSTGVSSGHGRIEATGAPLTAAALQRLACDGATTEVTLDSFGRPLDVGREHRTFTPKQRIALAIRDGACMFGDCDKEPSMTEAHHIIPWAEGGRTDLANGILLCKFHHLLVHDNGWEIYRVGTDYFLVPPPDVDPERRPRPMPSKSVAMRDVRREREHAG
ncbi:DUF222 domain-containing protein [Conyzicola sp.]|uniref:HNH endonuclease signature motif containing protein n=1 Tax=Conyzicola sp. TaxID=1969404 RepID=UPI003988A45A